MNTLNHLFTTIIHEIRANIQRKLKERIIIQNYNVTPQLPENELTIAECFAGGGLMAVGLKAAGYRIVWANDFDKNACKAYAANIGSHIIHGDITQIDPDDIPDVDVIAGGPPCQDYSVAGNGEGEAGERGKLVWTYLNVIQRKQPKAFVFENVKGLVSKRHRQTFDALLERFDAVGYKVSWRLINAWDYGVAQKRERVFIVGIRKDVGFTFQFPEPDAVSYRTQLLGDVIAGGLPESNHTGYGLRKDEEKYADRIPPGGNWRSLPETEQRAFMGGGFRNGGGCSGFLRRADWQSPAHTLDTAPLSKSTCQLHPSEQRRFTVRECLRIQSVPDTYVLPDDISLLAQYRIVGNGVASRVVYIIGIALAEQLKSTQEAV